MTDPVQLTTDGPIATVVLDNAILTGHTGYVVRELYALAYGEALDDVRAWMDGAPVRVLNAGG